MKKKKMKTQGIFNVLCFIVFNTFMSDVSGYC